MFDTGLVSISFRQLSPSALAAACAESGLRWIEWGSDVHAPREDAQRLGQILSLQQQYGLQCSSYGTYFKLGIDDVSALPGYIRAAKTLGTNILRLWCGSKNYQDLTGAEKEHILEESKKAAAIGAAEGAILCMECHNNTFTNCVDGALTLMETVNSPAFQMYWQPNQFRSLEDNLMYAASIAKYTKVIHVFNWEGNNRYPLADAAEIWKKYLTCFDGSQKLLLEFMPDDRPESLAAEARSLEDICSHFLK